MHAKQLVHAKIYKLYKVTSFLFNTKAIIVRLIFTIE